MKRWIITMILMAAILSVAGISAFAAPSPWAQSDIQSAIDQGLIPDVLQKGWQDDITRLDFCRLAVNLVEKRGYDFSQNSSFKTMEFADTDDQAVKKASFLGIVNGKKISGDKTWFCPNEPITRQEAAKMLYAMTMIGQNTVIPKASSAMLIPHVYSDRLYAQTAGKSFVCPGSWALSGIDFCYNSGVLTGAPGNRFDPGGHFTREQAYLTMLRMYRWAAAGGLSATASGVRFLYYDAASGLYGYRDASGNTVIPAQYKTAKEFQYGYAVVSNGDGNCAIIDSAGKTVALNNPYNGRFSSAAVISGTRAYVYEENQTGMIEGTVISLPDGNVILDNCIVAGECTNGWYSYCQLSDENSDVTNWFDGSTVGYLDREGNVALTARYLRVGDFYDGVTIAEDVSKNWFLIDETGAPVSKECGIDFEKYSIFFSWGKYAEIQDKITGSLGLMTFDGKPLIPCDNYSITLTKDGNFIAGSATGPGGGFLYDRNGKKLSAAFDGANHSDFNGLYGLAFSVPGGSSNGDGYYRLSDKNGKIISQAPMGNVCGDPACDGDSVILYSIYIDPPDNKSNLAITEGSWIITMDTDGHEIWRTSNVKRAEFVSGMVKIERGDNTIEYYTPNGSLLSPAIESLPPDPDAVIPGLIRDTLKGEEAPTDAQREEMAQKLGVLGFSVLRDNENMLNYKPVAKFFEDAAAGINGEATVYTYPYSYVIARTFSYQNGKMTCKGTEYNEGGTRSEATLDVDEFAYTQKGNLIYQIAGESDKSGFRVLPLSEQSREFYRKYIVPVNVFTQGPLNVSFDSGDYSQLNWEWIFQRLWKTETGTEMVDPASPYYQKAPDSMHFDSAKFPVDVVESLLQKYFDVPTEILRKLDTYDQKSGTYTFCGFNGGGYSPTLEVSKWRENTDGSLTLWIDFVVLEFSKELSAQSILTVMPSADGSFRYISNDYTAY